MRPTAHNQEPDTSHHSQPPITIKTPDEMMVDERDTGDRTDLDTEQAYFHTLYEHLDQLREDSLRRLHAVMKESGGTPQARSERDSYNAMFTADIKKYDAAQVDLCFGRIDLPVDDQASLDGTTFSTASIPTTPPDDSACSSGSADAPGTACSSGSADAPGTACSSGSADAAHSADSSDTSSSAGATHSADCQTHIDPSEETLETRYIGRLGLLDEDNDYRTLLLDWRAPLARPFYLATTAHSEGVWRRRTFHNRGRKITSLTDEFLDLSIAPLGSATNSASLANSAGVAGESALLAAMNAARTGHMRDIVATIQREQDEVIRSPHRGVLVVEGGPGTGKTAVALHRAAYLLYTYRQQLERSGVLVLGPNERFLNYISQVLPTLGETGVVLATLGSLYPGVTATLVDSLPTREIKGSLVMVNIMAQAVKNYQIVPDAPIGVPFDGTTIQLSPRAIVRARGRARSSRRPHNAAREVFERHILSALAQNYTEELGRDESGVLLLSSDDVTEIHNELSRDKEVAKTIAQLWPQLDARNVLSDLLSDKDRLREAAPQLIEEDISFLYREKATDFSPEDTPLLDEIAELIGEDERMSSAAADLIWKQQVADAQDALDILVGSANMEFEDELDSEILAAYDIVDAEQLAARQERIDTRTTAERATVDRTWTYGHVIIDEAQELSAMAWRMVMRRSANRWMTVVGDPAQTGNPAGVEDWHTTLSPYVADRWQLHRLTINYRTPSEIMELAAEVLDEISPTATIPQSIRSSGRLAEGIDIGSPPIRTVSNQPMTSPFMPSESTIDQPSPIELSLVKPSAIEPSPVKPSVIEPFPVKPSVIEPSAIEPSLIEQSASLWLAAIQRTIGTIPPERSIGIIVSQALLPGITDEADMNNVDLNSYRNNPDDYSDTSQSVLGEWQIIDVDHSKGLEFDSVIVVDPLGILDESPQGLNNLYVAITRSTQWLTIIHDGEVPYALRKILY